MYAQHTDPLTGATILRRSTDGAFIPTDPGNADWQAYRSWIEAGNTPTALDSAPPVKPTTRKANKP